MLIRTVVAVVFGAVGRLHVYLDDELHRRAKSKASLRGKTLQEYVAEAIAARVAADEAEDREAGRG